MPADVWPVLHYDDTEAAVRFLVDAVGFRAAVVVRDDDGDVVHAELCRPGGGTVLVGGTKHTGGVHDGLRAGAVYVATDDVDAVHERVLAAGGDVFASPRETRFAAGGPTRAFSCRDPEGNLWTVGTYRGAPAPRWAVDARVLVEYGQFHVYGDPDAASLAERAVGDAHRGDRMVGAAGAFLVVLSPVSMTSDALVRLELWASEPALELDDVDHVEEVDLDVVGGRLFLAECLATDDEVQAYDVASGRYRVRMSGWGYDEAVAGGGNVGGSDAYRLQLWPRDADADPVQHKRWRAGSTQG